MKHLSRVVWNEGMHLAQHHFQAQSRYVEDSIHFALSQLFFRPYGLLACELDGESLRNGMVLLTHARGIMPDGLPFDMPASDAVPEPVRIDGTGSPIRDSHLVQLAIPAFREGHANTSLESNGESASTRHHARYQAHDVVRPDDVTGRDERAVSLGRKNIRLVLDASPVEGLVTLPIARVRRAPSGQFMFDEQYIPPSMQIGASPRLLQVLHRLVDVLDAKSDGLARGRRGAAGEFAAQEIAGFWLLHTIHASLAPLRDLLQTRQAHPEQLFVEMSRLAGALCTFALDAHPRSLPQYDHDDLERCFDALDRHIRAHLDIVAPGGATVIPLQRGDSGFYAGMISDQRCYGQSKWFLTVRSPARQHDVVATVTSLVRVCTSRFLPKLVSRALPGMTLRHVPLPPAGISPRNDTVYFGIERSGPCWDTLVGHGDIGAWVPDSLPGADLELVVLAE